MNFIDNFLFLAQLWKYDSTTKLLTSKLGIWTSDETWNMFEGAEGNIEGISSNQVLGLKDDATETGTEVVLEAIDSSDQQIWSVESESEEYDGFVTLQNKITQKILTAKSETMLTIEGTLKFLKNSKLKLFRQSVNCPVDVVKVHFSCTTPRGKGLALSSSSKVGRARFFLLWLIDGRDDIDVSHGQFSKIIRLIHLLLLLTFFMTSTMQLLIQSIINFFSQFHSLFS